MRCRCAAAVTLLSLLAILPVGCGTRSAEIPAPAHNLEAQARETPQKPDAQAREAHETEAPAQESTHPTSPTRVTIDNFAYTPRVLTVSPGTRVTWINQDDVPHTVTSSAKPRVFASATLDTNDTFQRVFDKPGTYSYFCAVHPHMTATIVVK